MGQKHRIGIIPVQSVVYAVIKVTAASSMNQCPLVAGWGKVTGGSNLERRIADAGKQDDALRAAKLILTKDGEFTSRRRSIISKAHMPVGSGAIYCGWTDAKTRKLQMETDKALRRHVAKFRFDVAKKLSKFSFFNG